MKALLIYVFIKSHYVLLPPVSKGAIFFFFFGGGGGKLFSSTVERATPGQEIVGSIPAPGAALVGYNVTD